MLLSEINHSTFRKYAKWERQNPTEDDYGRLDPDNWIEILGQRCRIDRQSGYFEREEAGKETAKSGIVLMTRYRKEIAYDESLRINYKGNYYDIESIENVEEADVYLVFHAIIADRQNRVVMQELDQDPMIDLSGDVMEPLP